MRICILMECAMRPSVCGSILSHCSSTYFMKIDMEIKSAVRIVLHRLYKRAVSATGHATAGINAALVWINSPIGLFSSAKVTRQGTSYSLRVGSKCSQPSRGDAAFLGGDSIFFNASITSARVRCSVVYIASLLLRGFLLPSTAAEFSIFQLRCFGNTQCPSRNDTSHSHHILDTILCCNSMLGIPSLRDSLSGVFLSDCPPSENKCFLVLIEHVHCECGAISPGGVTVGSERDGETCIQESYYTLLENRKKFNRRSWSGCYKHV